MAPWPGRVCEYVELVTATATAADTLPDLADAPELCYEESDGEAEVPPTPEWIDRLQRFDPARVFFAHDHAVWEP